MQENKPIYGIIGNPVRHSLSPVMHNAAFRELGVDASYQLFHLEEDELADFFSDLKNDDSPIFGLNVTVPYKEKVTAYMDSLTPLARRIQAVNTIVINKERKLAGYNTDAPGFMAHLAELQVETAGKTVAILGAGGSARAVVSALCLLPERPAAVRLYNRTPSRLRELIDDLKTRMDISLLETYASLDQLGIDLCDILINTTSVGLKEDDPCPVDPEDLHGGLFVYDLIYKPAETALLRSARQRGCRTANGLGMLYFQGVLAFQHWADTQLDDRVKNAMREALEKENSK